jgi:predicted MPP superfamily phosphohydrolase
MPQHTINIHPNRTRIEHEGHQHSVKRGFLGGLHWENFDILNPLVEFLMKATGLYSRGYHNAMDIRLERVSISLPRLPKAFNGFRILWVSDIHVERFDTLPGMIQNLVQPLEYDLCIFGGDSCFEHFISDKVLVLTRQIIEGLVAKSPVFGILGNHDFTPVAYLLDSLGVRLLLNENTAIERAGQKLWFAGVDDCHYFNADDLDAALRDIPAGDCKILLSHSPELYKRAAVRDIDLCLSGHTHGGQICLPGEISIISSASVPRRIRKGMWQEGAMKGYTCRGCAASGAPVRFNCRPEITLFTLEK